MTNDIFTREDQEFLIKNKALPKSRIEAIETGGCPHAAIREDISANMGALEKLQAKFGCQMLFVESGGDNLAANYSRELADYIVYVIDVSGGDKIPRKGGPGISQSDLLVINKVRTRRAPEEARESADRARNADRPRAVCWCVAGRHAPRLEADAGRRADDLHECQARHRCRRCRGPHLGGMAYGGKTWHTRCRRR